MPVATDPVQQIRELEHQTLLALDPRETLARLAALPPSTEAPYLTICLDWRPEGSAPGRVPAPAPKRSERRAREDVTGAPRRPAWEGTRRELDDLIAGYGPRGAAFDSLTADVARLADYLEQELDPAAQGVVIVACQQQGVFEPVPLDVPVATGVTIAPIPALRQLVSATEDYPPHAVLVADQRDAFLWFLARRTWERGVQIEASGYPRKQQQGGWSQRRYQARADERVEAFARTIAEETRRELGEGRDEIPYLIIAADEPISSALDAALHASVESRIIGRIHLPMEASIAEIAAAAAPLVDEAERRRELAAVEAARDGAGAGGRGVTGPTDTLTALETGQVMTLVMNDDFSRPAWADYSLPVYGVGEVPREHPAAGDVANIVPTRLEDEVVRLALQTGATVEIVQTAVPIGATEMEEIPDADDPTPRTPAALALDELGGIAAVLRFALDEGWSTAEL
jgi:peptide subunit release factor 1 (eRF1)